MTKGKKDCRYCGAKRRHSKGCTRPKRKGPSKSKSKRDRKPPTPPPKKLCPECGLRMIKLHAIRCIVCRSLREGADGIYLPSRHYQGGSKLPKQPTKAQPGSVGKIEVMRERALNGASLTHPGDESLEGTVPAKAVHYSSYNPSKYSRKGNYD